MFVCIKEYDSSLRNHVIRHTLTRWPFQYGYTCLQYMSYIWKYLLKVIHISFVTICIPVHLWGRRWYNLRGVDTLSRFFSPFYSETNFPTSSLLPSTSNSVWKMVFSARREIWSQIEQILSVSSRPLEKKKKDKKSETKIDISSSRLQLQYGFYWGREATTSKIFCLPRL